MQIARRPLYQYCIKSAVSTHSSSRLGIFSLHQTYYQNSFDEPWALFDLKARHLICVITFSSWLAHKNISRLDLQVPIITFLHVCRLWDETNDRCLILFVVFNVQRNSLWKWLRYFCYSVEIFVKFEVSRFLTWNCCFVVFDVSRWRNKFFFFHSKFIKIDGKKGKLKHLSYNCLLKKTLNFEKLSNIDCKTTSNSPIVVLSNFFGLC